MKGRSAAAALVEGIRKVSADWAKQRKAEERHASAQRHRMDRLLRVRTVSVKEAAFDVMEKAYTDASDNGVLPANARQIMYAARPDILRITGRDSFDDAYFTQQLLPGFVDLYPEVCADWDVVYDARGSFIEPHTDREVAIGTLEVRNYLQHRGVKKTELGGLREEPQFPTYGPENRYRAILFIEKEGFDPLLRAAQIAQRFDIAIMSTKGMSTTAARQLLDQLSPRVEQILVLHDFDVSGFTIFGTLASDSRRYQFRNKVRIVDIGLRLADVEALDLQSEPVSVSGKWASRAETLAQYGATGEEIAFLRDQRVELNAMTSRQFVDHLEAKFAEHGVTKVLPEEKVLEGHARYLLEVLIANQELAKVMPEVRKQAAAQQLPADLRKLVAKQFEKTPAWAWDRAVVDLVKRLPPPKPPPKPRRKKPS
jgi:hypothetical protein